MNQLINWLLILSTVIYAILIMSYTEHIEFFPKLNVKWEKGCIPPVFFMLLFFLSSFGLPIPITVSIILVASVLYITLIIKFSNSLIEEFFSNFLILISTFSILGIPSIVWEISPQGTILSWIKAVLGLELDEGVLLNFFLLLISGIALTLNRIFKGKIRKEIWNANSLKFTLLSWAVALFLVQAQFGITTFNGCKLTGTQHFWLLLLIILLGILAYINSVHTNQLLQRERELVENTAFEQYTQELETAYDALRVIKHDYTNILSSIKLYIDEKNIDGLKKYYYHEFDELTKEIQADRKVIDALQKVRVKELKSILVYKLSLAAELDLDIHLEVRYIVGNVPISKVLLCQIIGILLDNAIEASRESTKKQLKLAIISEAKKTTILIENSWVSRELPLKKFFEKGFSTKGNNRGLGLFTVDELVEKHDQLDLETQISDERFLQIFTMKGAV